MTTDAPTLTRTGDGEAAAFTLAFGGVRLPPMSLEAVWNFTFRIQGEVGAALRPPLTPEQRAPYTGPCPPWCQADRHSFEAQFEYHFRVLDDLTLTLCPFDDHPNEHDSLQVSIAQHVLEDPQPAASLFCEAQSIRLTAAECRKLAGLLQTSADLLERATVDVLAA